jgi:phosphoribosylamine--glycine ligase
MMTARGPMVLEFNCRFGDPETQPILMRMDSDLVDALEASADGTLNEIKLDWTSDATVCVVVASGGYPGIYENGKTIHGLKEADALENVKVFHAGTSKRDGSYYTAGGRVLGVTARGPDLKAAVDRAYEAVGKISFEGAYSRKDIAAKALK